MSPLLRRSAPVLLLAVAACAHAPRVATIAPPPIVALPAPPPPAMPAGGRPGMTIPPRLADGRFMTPNEGLNGAAAAWHLRTALNVAALACRGADESAIIAGYNAMLAARKGELQAAESAVSAQYRGSGSADWRNDYDNAMTRLYNYWSQDFARADFCRAAATALAEVPGVPAGGLAGYANTTLGALDRPFTEFYAAYAAWRDGQARQPVIALAATPPAPAPAAAEPSIVGPIAAAPAARPAPHLTIDVAALGER